MRRDVTADEVSAWVAGHTIGHSRCKEPRGEKGSGNGRSSLGPGSGNIPKTSLGEA